MGQVQGEWEVITDEDFDSEFLDRLEYGAVLGFKQADDSMKHWKVCRVNRKNRKWYIKPWKLYDPSNMEQLQADRRQQMQDDFNKELVKLLDEDSAKSVRDLMARHAFYQIPTAMGRTTTIRTTDNDQPDLLTYDEWEELHEEAELDDDDIDDVPEDEASDPGPVPPAAETDTVRDPADK